MAAVMIGVDPHKGSHTAVAVGTSEEVLGQVRVRASAAAVAADPRYVAHGSDLGAGVTARLARAQPGTGAGIHLATPGLAPPPQPWSPAEQAHFAEVDA